ncbi:restriction endonuclease subunit S [uncultured Nostoc sp.]|uniref:restriction endonuclease subunit S n=1 Tax=uncultured Nostoc sp. TaxID=340711 RepID=UPI0035CC02D4
MTYISEKLTLKDSGITWIKEIPKHWDIGILSNYVQIIASNVDKKKYEDEMKVLLCNYTDVYYNRFITSTIDFMEASATKSEVEKFSLEINDVLITKDSETPDDIAVPSLVNEEIPNLVCGYHLSILRPLMDKLDGKYLLFSIISTSIKSQFSSLATGITRYGLSYKHIKNINICVPPLQEQKAIASFLDRKTATIDILIAKKQRLIQLLEEKRTALINQAVTKGLNPNVPMKDSRIPWIGYIPEHWKAIQIRRYIRRIEQGWSPVAEDRIAQGNEWAVLKLNSVSKGEFHPNEYKVLSEDTKPDKRFEVKHGDLLLSRANTPQLVGEVCYVKNPPRRLMLCDLLYRLDINERLLNKRFCTYYLFSKSGKAQISADARGTSQSMVKISQGHIKTWIIPLPPSLEEQESIANYIDGQLAYIKNITHRIIQQIKKLQEYRQSLITAAVTGKIDIREEVAA